jgi:hypothetical protein
LEIDLSELLETDIDRSCILNKTEKICRTGRGKRMKDIPNKTGNKKIMENVHWLDNGNWKRIKRRTDI